MDASTPPSSTPETPRALLESSGVKTVLDVAGALARAEALGLDPTVSVGPGHPDQVRHPVTWSRSELRPPTPPPTLGQHDDQLRSDLSARGEPT